VHLDRHAGSLTTLHLHVPFRSSDVLVGLPYDMMYFTLLADALATSLSAARREHIRAESITLALANAHIYRPHYATAMDMATCIANDQTPLGGPPLPTWTLDAIAADPDTYVSQVADTTHLRQTAQFPRLAVVV
jgi:thymidylate synthase